MSTSNIEYMDSRGQMNLATFSEEQISFQLDKSRNIELESENNAIKLKLKTKEQCWNKDRAILTQKIELLESHIHESKIRQENLQKMNETFMNTLTDLTANPKNFSNKMLKELQQLFENRLQMDPDTEQKLQKSQHTIRRQQDEIDEYKKKVSQQDSEIQFLKRKMVDNEKIIENSLLRQQQDLARLSQGKNKEYKSLEKENKRMKQMYENDILALQKKNSEALNQISQLQQRSPFEDQQQYNNEIQRLNNIIETMSLNHKMEIELMQSQTKNEINIMENNQKKQQHNANQRVQQTPDSGSQSYISKIQQLENEKSEINTELEDVLSKLHQVSEQNTGISSTLQIKETQIEELKKQVSQMQTSMSQTCQDFFDVELQISRIEPERSKRRSIVNESLISNLTQMNNNANGNFGNGLNGNGNENGLNMSNNTSSNGFGNNSSNTNLQLNTGTFSNPNIQIPLLQNNLSNSQNGSNTPLTQNMSQSIQLIQDQKHKSEQLKLIQSNPFIRQGSLTSSELSNCDTFGNPSAVKNKRVISATTSSHNLIKDFINAGSFKVNSQQILRSDSSIPYNQNQQQQINMDTSIEKKDLMAGQIVLKKKLQSVENMESQTSTPNLKTEDTVYRRDRITTASGSFQEVGSSNNVQQKHLKNKGTSYHNSGIYLNKDQSSKGLTLQELQSSSQSKNSNQRNNSLNPQTQKLSSEGNQLFSKTQLKNTSLNNSNMPLSVSDLKKSMTDQSLNNNNINCSMAQNTQPNINYNSNQSLTSSNLLGVSQSINRGNTMSQSSLLNQEQSFLVRAIQENMQERLTLEEKMKNLETEVQNYIMINHQKTSQNNQTSFPNLVQQVMKELYTKQLNKSIFLLSKEERENVLKQEIKVLVDKVMVKPLQQRQSSQENKSSFINQSLNKSISIEEGLLKETKSPRYSQAGSFGSLSMSNILNSSTFSQSKGFQNFLNQNKENSCINPKIQTGSVKQNSNNLSRIQVKPNSTTSFSQHLQGLQTQNFFDKKITQLNINQTSTRVSRQLN